MNKIGKNSKEVICIVIIVIASILILIGAVYCFVNDKAVTVEVLSLDKDICIIVKKGVKSAKYSVVVQDPKGVIVYDECVNGSEAHFKDGIHGKLYTVSVFVGSKYGNKEELKKN